MWLSADWVLQCPQWPGTGKANSGMWEGRIQPGLSLGARTPWFEPVLLPPRGCFPRKLESGAKPGAKPRHWTWDMGVPLASAGRLSIFPCVILFFSFLVFNLYLMLLLA